MEFPNLGDHCQEPTCKILDFLPFKCDSCKKVYCCDQSSFKNKDFQVPLCPLCNQPVPYKRNELPDVVMSAHIDRDCKSDPAEERRRVFTNRCSLKGCKQKELIPFNCQKCRKNYCIRHRHENDHNCDTVRAEQTTKNASNTNKDDINSKRLLFFQKQEKKPQPVKTPIQPSSMSDAEALEYAIKLSLMESSKEKKQNNEDEALAKALAESEQQYYKTQNKNTDDKETCIIQ